MGTKRGGFRLIKEKQQQKEGLLFSSQRKMFYNDFEISTSHFNHGHTMICILSRLFLFIV